MELNSILPIPPLPPSKLQTPIQPSSLKPLAALVHRNRYEDAVCLFLHRPDPTFLSHALHACACSGDLKTGTLLHSLAARHGFLGKTRRGHVANSILAMYVNCGELESARRFFDGMVDKDLVSWNSMISGVCKLGELEEAVGLFEEMQSEGFKPGVVTWNVMVNGWNDSGRTDKAVEVMRVMESEGVMPDVCTWTGMISGFARNDRAAEALGLFKEMLVKGVEPNGVTLAVVLSVCASLKLLGKGREVHCVVLKLGYGSVVLVCNSMVDMYCKCDAVEDAERVFCGMPERDAFTWNSMIGGYAQCGYCGKAYDLFSKMEGLGVRRNVVTWNALISGYMRNGDEEQAMELFEKMESEGVVQSTVSWNLLIAGSLHNGNKSKAMAIFRQMMSLDVRPNRVTLLSVLPALADLTSILKVKEIHACILRRGLKLEVSLLNALIDTYAKSADIVSARYLFDNTSDRDVITWNSLISGYVLHRRPVIALELFDQMKSEKVRPNQTTLLRVIYAYGLLKMVNEGKELFFGMAEHYQISQTIEHYTAMVDLLGRSGKLQEVTEFIENMPIKSDIAVWFSLLSASRIHGNIEMAKLAVKQLAKLESMGSVLQLQLLQLQGLCMCKKSNSMRLYRGHTSDRALGCSWIEYSERSIEFSTGQRCIPNSKSIYAKLDSLADEIEKANQDIDDKYLSIEEEDQEEITGIHSEKLAITFGLLSVPNYKSIRIVKKLRMCLSCHNFAKYVSSAYRHEMLLRDSSCLHHFKDGQCNCSDYW